MNKHQRRWTWTSCHAAWTVAAVVALMAAGCGDPAGSGQPAGTFTAAATDSSIGFDVTSNADTATTSDGAQTTPDTGIPKTNDTAQPAGSCAGKCGSFDANATCQCNSACEGAGDCCADYAQLCKTPADSGPTDSGTSDVSGDGGVTGSCVGKCGKYEQGASCQCDSGCAQYGDCCPDLKQVCGGDDAGTTDAGEPDTTTPDITQPDAGGDGGAPAGSCAGKCGKYDSKASCQCDSGCKSYGDCCADLDKVCGGDGCKEDKDCDDSLECTDEKCTAGKCSNPAKAGHCLIENNCYKDGETGDNACQKCDAAADAEAWTVQAGASCDDGNACTEGDQCNAAGECAGNAKAGCCSADVDCAGNDPCKAGKCDTKTGTCSYDSKPDCCSSGACCDPATNTAKGAGTLCGSAVVSTEYKCDGKEVQKREAFEGCDGKATAACSSAKGDWSWSQWSTILTCGDKQTCTAQGDKQPVCKDDAVGECKDDAGCDDGNTCTTDKCDAGKCKHTVVKGCCNFESDCDDNNKCTIDQCEENKCISAKLPCEGSSDCETAACDPATGKCTVKVNAGMCKIGDSCYKDGDLKTGEVCLGCVSKVSASDWSISAKCACKSGVCCDTIAGKI